MVVIGLVAACSASPSLYFSGPQYYTTGYNYPAAVASPIKSQYHAQNELGHYSYGYNDGYSTKSETKHPNGLTEGAYSYVDPNGVLQQYRYVSDENGYRVSGTNLPVAPVAPAVPAVPVVPEVVATAPVAVPASDAQLPQQVQDTPEVAAAKVAHQIAYDEAKKAADAAPAEADQPSSEAVEIQAAPVVPVPAVPAVPVAPVPVAKTVVPVSKTSYTTYHPTAYAAYPSYAYAAAPAPVVPSYAYAAPAAVPSYAYAAAAPSYTYGTYASTVPYAPTVYSGSPVNSQYHAQDEFGQYSYGYNSGTSSKSEVKTLDGITRGGYSYVDANGLVQQYNYVSDPVNGFRVSGTNLPVNC